MKLILIKLNNTPCTIKYKNIKNIENKNISNKIIWTYNNML